MGLGVLVAYATKHGATQGIASKVGAVLREQGLDVTVADVMEAGNPADYDVVVLGSAVYMGRWRKAAAMYLREHETALAARPVWLFSSGPTGEGEPSARLDGWTFPEKLRPVADRIGPRDIALFHGALDMNQLGFVERFLVKGIKAPIGDYRDWATIQAWASGIAEAHV